MIGRFTDCFSFLDLYDLLSCMFVWTLLATSLPLGDSALGSVTSISVCTIIGCRCCHTFWPTILRVHTGCII